MGYIYQYSSADKENIYFVMMRDDIVDTLIPKYIEFLAENLINKVDNCVFIECFATNY